MKVIVKNKGKKQVRTPWPIRGKVDTGKSQEFEVANQGIETLMVMAYAVGMEKSKIEVTFVKDGKTYRAVKGGSLPSLVEV